MAHRGTARRPLASLLAAALTGSLLALLPAAPAAAEVAPSPTDRTVEFTAGGLQPLQPARLLDTRSTGRTTDGEAQAGGIVEAGTSRTLQVAGRGGVPGVGAGAVWLNVTVTQAQSGGHLTVHPTGTAVPNASNLNFTRGQTAPNLVLAKLGTDGRVDLRAAASTHVLADVVGWVPEGRDVQALQPARVLDTRGTGRTVDGAEQATGAFGAGETRLLPIAGRAGVPATGVGAVIVNVTAVGPTKGGHLTVHPSGSARPNASSLNFAPGTITPNLVVAKVGPDGSISIQNVGGSTSILADVVGWIPAESAYTALTPARVLDTRSSGVTVDGQSKATGALGAGEARRLPVTGRGGVPVSGVGAVVVNLTGTAPTSATHLTVFPSGTTLPNASNLNLTRSATRANLVVAKVGADGAISISNAAGTTHVIADVVGWFPSGVASSNPDAPSGRVKMVLPVTTELAGAGDVQSFEGAAERPTSLTLAPGADVPPAGGHLVVMPSGTLPDGTLVRVNAVAQNQDGSTTLSVQRAAVPDALVDLEISYKGPLELEDRGLPTGTEAGLQRGLATGEQELRDPGMRGAERTKNFSFGPATKAGFTCSGAAAATMSFTSEFQSSTVEIDVDVSERYLKFIATTTPAVTASASLDGSATCTREISLPGKLPLGPTGLFLSADLALDITSTGNITASASVSTPLTMGFEYRPGSVTNLSKASYTGSAGIEEETTQAALTITPTLELDLEFLGLVEVGLLLATPLTGTVIPLSTPCATLDVSGSLGAEFELEFPMWEYEREIGTFNLGSRRVFEGECGQPAPGTYSGTVRIGGEHGQLTSTLTYREHTFEGAQDAYEGMSLSHALTQTFTLHEADLSPNREIGLEPGSTQEWRAVPGDPGLPAPPVMEISSYERSHVYRDPEEPHQDCSSTVSGFTPVPSNSGLRILALAPDGRLLKELNPGDTVLIEVGSSFTSPSSLSPDGGDVCTRATSAAYGTYWTPQADPLAGADGTWPRDTVHSCPAGTIERPSAHPGYGECTFSVVLGPDRSLKISQQLVYEQVNYLKYLQPESTNPAPNTGPVVLNVELDLKFNP